MRVKTGEVVTTRTYVDVQYRCSSCGEDNLVTQTIKGSAHTGTIMGFNLDQDLVTHARDNLSVNLATVQNRAHPHRFRAAGFTCKCRKCGHAEPWARMNYDRLEKPQTISISILIVSIILSLVGLRTGEFNFVHLFFFAILALSAAVCLGIYIYKNQNTKKMEQLIAKLPRESIPTIIPHSNTKHNAFSGASTGHTSTGAAYDKWVCAECGTHNSTQHSQCKKCGKYKCS